MPSNFCRCHRRFRRNADESIQGLRRLAAQGDLEAAAKVIHWSWRLGEIPRIHMRLAAQLGDPTAQQILPDEKQIPWFDPARSDRYNRKIQQEVFHKIASHKQRPLAVKLGVAMVKHCAPIMEAYHRPGENVFIPSAALRAAINWADEPTEENQLAARHASELCRELRPTSHANVPFGFYCFAAQQMATAAFLGTTEDQDFVGSIIDATDVVAEHLAPLGATENQSVGTARNAEYQWQSDLLIAVLLGQKTI